MLSEAAVLGFEYGYSLADPTTLTLWEAQFGDFANGAQVIIDQFIVSGEEKWNRLSGLTMLLPHGYEGQGPEHSSAKLERFLALAAEDNIQVCQPTTPAQVFHLLRRQVHRPWRKPLIVMSPKSLLRLPEATSTIEELTRGQFQRILLDPAVPAGTADADRVRKVFLCTGKIYYELVAERQRRGDGETAILRLEQLYPLSAEVLAAQVAAYRHAEQVVWVQDEPENMGALPFLLPRLNRLFGTRFRWASRDESASPATGSHKAHAIEQQRLLDKAFAQPAG
jgi:2-oxoglutarate dehydrogenase E1 component